MQNLLSNKTVSMTELRDPAKALLEELSPRLASLTGFRVTSKLFRPHRDVRFSKDKTPYTTHLHMMWTVQSGSRQDSAFRQRIPAEKVGQIHRRFACALQPKRTDSAFSASDSEICVQHFAGRA